MWDAGVGRASVEAEAGGAPNGGRATKAPQKRGFPVQCAEEDSNLHGVIPHKALNFSSTCTVAPLAPFYGWIGRRRGINGRQ